MQYLKKLLILFLAVFVLITAAACKGGIDPADATKLSFKGAASYDFLKTLDGKPVTINGYLATSSPADGSFIFLMNLPYQSCPFCVPNTSQLSNTMKVYPAKGEKFSYTTSAVKVYGRLEVAPDPGKPFTDRYGYTFSFRIVDATYTILKEEIGADMVLWQKIAATDVISEIHRMYDYVNFTVAWHTYAFDNYTDAKAMLENEKSQFHYGYAAGYFDGIVKKIESVDPTAFTDLVANVRKAEALAAKGIAELEAGNYTSEYKYLDRLGREDYIYTLNKAEELSAEMKTIYGEFSNWFSGFEF